MRIVILDLARDDLLDAYQFYEQQGKGLGDYFLKNLYSEIDSLEVLAGIHRQVYKSFFRALSKKFPFAIYYTTKEGTVFIKAIVDCRRHPSWTRKHIA